MLHVLLCVRFTSSYGITLQRGTEAGVNLEVYVDLDYASKAIDWRSDLGSVVMCTKWCFWCLFLTCVICVYALHLQC